MIIVISGSAGSGKSKFARVLAESIFPQTPEVIDELPQRKPKYLGSMTIFTHQNDADLPTWLVNRSDYTLIRITKYNLPTRSHSPRFLVNE